MTRAIHTVRDVAAWRMCMGCGVCRAACQQRAIRLVNVEEEGIRPLVDEGRCASCGDCIAACPGLRLDADLAMDGRPKQSDADHEFGQTLEIWEGHATDPEVRRRASSGGMLSALSLYCLEREAMRFVLHAGMDPDRPWLNKTFASVSRDDVLARCGSRYAPASPGEGLDRIESTDGPCVFVGKPCDAAGATILRRRRPDLDRNLGAVLTFCCAGTPSTRGTLELLAREGAEPSDLASLRYRGEGWPGRFGADHRDGRRLCDLTYRESWGWLTSYVSLRCRLCPDGLGRLSDIACGDAWQSYEADRPNGSGDGLSLVLVRTERGREILRGARDAGYVTVKPVEPEQVLEAQKSLLVRRRVLYGRFLAFRMTLTPHPRYAGFSLLPSWRRLPLSPKVRSVVGTLRRIATRGLWRRRPEIRDTMEATES